MNRVRLSRDLAVDQPEPNDFKSLAQIMTSGKYRRGTFIGGVIRRGAILQSIRRVEK